MLNILETPASLLIQASSIFVFVFFFKTEATKEEVGKPISPTEQSAAQIRRYLQLLHPQSTVLILRWKKIQKCFLFFLKKVPNTLLPGFLMKLNFQRMTPARCVQRVKALERYCTELLRCEPRISQSSDLIHFFIPKEEELQPEFAQNRYPIFYPSTLIIVLRCKLGYL